MSRMGSISLSFFLLSAISLVLIQSARATEHVVGGVYGWSIHPDKMFYQNWAQGRTFVPGDKLVFIYQTPVHNVQEVTKEDYEACTQTRTISMRYLSPTVFDLTEGTHYYYCGVGTHCEKGQKFFITVKSA